MSSRGCVKVRGKLFQVFIKLPQGAITVTWQTVSLLPWNSSQTPVIKGHIHPSGKKKPTESGFHLLSQVNKYKCFSLNFQILHSLTKRHFPNSPPNVVPTHPHWPLQRVSAPSVHPAWVSCSSVSANPNLRYSTGACLPITCFKNHHW